MTNTERINFRFPKGTKARLESLRKKLGYRSVNALANDLLLNGRIPKTNK